MTRRALISVTDKTGVVEFAQQLVELGFSILSTGGTFRVLQEGGVPAVGFFTGAGLLRPGVGQVINYRASYSQEVAAVLEAALHELDHLRHGHGAHGVSSSSHDRGLLDTNDGGLTHADGGIMSMAHDAVYVSIGPRTVTGVPDRPQRFRTDGVCATDQTARVRLVL